MTPGLAGVVIIPSEANVEQVTEVIDAKLRRQTLGAAGAPLRFVAGGMGESYVVGMLMRSVLIAVVFFSTLAIAAEPKIEKIGAFSGTAPEAVKQALAENGFRVTGDDGKVLAEIWTAKSPTYGKNDASSALYPDFVSGTFYGVMILPNGTTDYRGQKIPSGTYSLRYELLPTDGNHMGVAPNPDFFLLIPAEVDPGPEVRMSATALVRASTKASGTAHPAAFALASADPKGLSANQDQGHTIASFSLDGKTSIGLILSGGAE